MVLSVKPFSSSKSAVKYYSHGDYYGKEGVGLWYGKGAAELDLKGEFEAKTDQNFNSILNGRMPNGQILGRRTKEGIEHRPGYDLTLSCPKSFSIQMLLYADKEQRKIMEQALMRAVSNTLDFIERKGYLIARKGKGGAEKEQIKNLIFSKFLHTTNRNLEPQAHVHCFLANSAKCSDGKFRSLSYDKIMDNVKFFGQIFRNELALEVKKLGFNIRTTMLSDKSSSFELSHIHPELIKEFSTRRQEIEELCKQYGITTKEGRDRIVINSRKAKKTVEQEVLMQTWHRIESNVMAKVEDKHNWQQPVLKPFVSPPNRVTTTPAIKIQHYDKITTHEIYKALYSRIHNILPEFGFVSKGNHYVSTTTHKIDGSEGKKGKVHIWVKLQVGVKSELGIQKWLNVLLTVYFFKNLC